MTAPVLVLIACLFLLCAIIVAVMSDSGVRANLIVGWFTTVALIWYVAAAIVAIFL